MVLGSAAKHSVADLDHQCVTRSIRVTQDHGQSAITNGVFYSCPARSLAGCDSDQISLQHGTLRHPFTTRPRVGGRATARKTESHSGVSDAGSFQREEPVARPLKQPARSLRRPPMRAQVSGSGFRDAHSATSVEDHQACLATVETLERENEALRGDKKTLIGANKSSEQQATRQLVDEMQHTVAGWHQRLRSPAGVAERVDPAALTTALPATTAVPDMWPTQEEEGGAFGDDHDMVPESGNFAQLFQL
ncbi:hypothetical protein BDQ94DRAFT_175742 [Aspergillus welwitschiae]|uniref:Uncharacterized protein n=1 Tax=Aspergillus welwitschiae TaxID=1341132 RepID=A0A3F3PK63_9EURO|nr:hypothetical protein BDQ94DRAFT_175742 [Aspergillus welwitschiae]RDH27267.1 hypothetical protein BDQ94DRAFT_175742 [Aspergillus welwitschiae]